MKLQVALSAILAMLLSVRALAQQKAPCEILVPVLDAAHKVQIATAPDGHSYPVFRVAEPSQLVSDVRQQLDSSFAQQALQLDRYARNMVLARHGDAEWLRSPMYLLLSNEEGGFARFGFWLEDKTEKRKLVMAGYVDLVVDPQKIEDGGFEEIFSHELGHLILRTLTGGVPNGPSRKMHQSMTITDYSTAFDEGYAEHFQPLVRDASTNPYLRKLATGTGASDFELLWLSNADTQLRTDGVKRNVFVHSKPLAIASDNPDLYRLFVEDETSTVFSTNQLKNGQQMMSSEGVISTVFYRIVNDTRLRSQYEEASFYQPFLQTAADPQKTITPYQNVNLKIFASIVQASFENQNRPPIIAVVQQYAKLFPNDAQRIEKIFVETTWGATVSQELASGLERAAAEGGRGDLVAFQKNQSFALLDSTIAEVTNGKRSLDANVGPQLWVLNSTFKIAPAVWDTERALPLTINLNTATEVELMTVPGVDLPLARKIVATRRERGFFRSIDDLHGVVSPELLRQLNSMASQMEKAGPYARD